MRVILFVLFVIFSVLVASSVAFKNRM